MAVLNLVCDDSDKENAPPPPPSAARGNIAVKRQTMKKKPGGGSKAPRRRPPLLDITRFFVNAPCPPPSAVLPALSSGAALHPPRQQSWPQATEIGRLGAVLAPGRSAAKPGSHSLRKGFR